MDKLISVVIPTKNRYETLLPLLTVISDYLCDEIEIVVQDNSDNNDLACEWLKAHNVPNIMYFYSGEWKSVVDNCNDGISNSVGEYVTMIGDDDTISPQIIDVARILKKYKINTCSCNYSLYRWEQALLTGKNAYEYTCLKKICKIIDVDKRVRQIMKGGIQNKDGLPCVYHGLVSRNLLNKLFEITGSYFPGPSPDMANAFGLSMLVKKNLVVSLPFIIDGYSKSSTGHLTENKTHVGKIEEQTFLPKDTAKTWICEIPFIWLPNTIWPDSALQAINRCNKDEYISYMNYAALYIKIRKLYPNFTSMCKEYAKKYSSNWQYITTYISVAVRFVLNRIKEKTHRKRVVVKEPISLQKAIEINSDYIDKTNMKSVLEKNLVKMYKSQSEEI